MCRTFVFHASLTALMLTTLVGCKPAATEISAPRIARVAQVQAAGAPTITVYPGEVRARYESGLGFRVAGKISMRQVDVGAHVHNGQVLAELDPADLQLAAASARATLASAEAAMKLAQSEHDRFQSLNEKRFVSQLELEAKTNTLEAARAHVAQAKAALSTARNQTGYTQLRADADGVITSVSGEAGQVVSAGQAIVTLAHDGASEVVINVPEHQIAKLSNSQNASVELWTESGTLHAAKVREIAPAADAVTRTYQVRVAFDDDSTLPRLGQTARVYFGAAADDGARLVALSALYEKDGKPALWEVNPETRKVRLVPVSVASYAEDGVLINSGIAGDAWIVTAGVHRLREGETIAPVDTRNRPISF